MFFDPIEHGMDLYWSPPHLLSEWMDTFAKLYYCSFKVVIPGKTTPPCPPLPKGH